MEIRYRYKGVPRFRVPQPWYEHTNWEPWDEDRVSWLLVNRNRRLIVQALIQGPLTLDELRERLQVHLTPYLADRGGLSLNISPEALTNHLHTMEHHGLIRREGDRYALNLPVLTLDEQQKLDSLSEALGQELAERLRQTEMEPEWLDPLLERATTAALETLDDDYEWETYRRWVEEYDADIHRNRRGPARGRTNRRENANSRDNPGRLAFGDRPGDRDECGGPGHDPRDRAG